MDLPASARRPRAIPQQHPLRRSARISWEISWAVSDPHARLCLCSPLRYLCECRLSCLVHACRPSCTASDLQLISTSRTGFRSPYIYFPYALRILTSFELHHEALAVSSILFPITILPISATEDEDDNVNVRFNNSYCITYVVVSEFNPSQYICFAMTVPRLP